MDYSIDMKATVYDSKDRLWTIHADRIPGMKSCDYLSPDDPDEYEITSIEVNIAGNELEVTEDIARKYIDLDELDFE